MCATIAAGGVLGAVGIANAGTNTAWIGTTDSNSRVHGQVSAWDGGSIYLQGSCTAGGWITTPTVNHVDNYYLKTDGTCWWGVGGYTSKSSG
ncbi:hypothetical protein R3Q06_31525 [Rhodococcus erythropolis]|uniref:hypothetical protein n=1 Tax=Rhodococcus erythropolis TaxID=1833 RepID=UPI00294A0E1D|nr:hypothetical protein [Rhodococcus erythropolis]MDV6278017.1 hypothetical protein [Rhodococcus erythropolis]